MKRFGFPRSARLLKPSEFDRVFKQRRSAADGFVIVYAGEGPSEQTRLGLTVSRKCGKATVRNRWKRALREAFRLVQHELPTHLDLVVLPRRGATPNVAQLQVSLKTLALRLARKRVASQRDEERRS